ncbi:hypothetical protein [Clostridium estertheticum]|uniref:hypothetical protein n=1 Tax=Clostridium estertheticum TaxID=238834 RepID=UPI001CF36806|nr:hypothetical protein [Clostridium estertheticum]MCB2354363.1 hypothetical protein [Clostridium estertheticum]WAG42518.1 hypothetical protein LL065_07550 [Clostridium estertheticum]
MANIPDNKKQVMITLPVEILEIIDKLAEDNYIKRSQQISRMIIELVKSER